MDSFPGASCYFQIRNIGRNRSSTTEDACKTLVCSRVTSRLDYDNALLYGVNNQYNIEVTHVQSTAARLITRSKKHDNITPVLMSLHWLQVEYRIQYKLLLCTFIALHGQAPIFLKFLSTIKVATVRKRHDDSTTTSKDKNFW